MIISIDEIISLHPIEQIHAVQLFDLVNVNRDLLRKWLPWVDKMRTLDHFRLFITEAKKRQLAGTESGYVIMVDGQMAGRIGLYNIDHQNKIASIGYWLDEGLQGKGIMSRCTLEMTTFGFDMVGLNRIEIRCATNNFKSQAIPERLNFVKEGVIRQGEFVEHRFIDLYSYAMLKDNWHTNGLRQGS